MAIVTDKKIHNYFFGQNPAMPWKKKEKQMNVRLRTKKVNVEIGWFSGDPFALFELKILELDREWNVVLLHFQIAKFVLDITLNGE